MLLVTTRQWYDMSGKIIVHKVDTTRKVFDPMSIIIRALFINQITCLSINANKFKTTILGNCIYFADEFTKFDQGSIGGSFRPFTLAREFVDYCKAIHTYELEFEGYHYSDGFESEDEFSSSDEE